MDFYKNGTIVYRKYFWLWHVINWKTGTWPYLDGGLFNAALWDIFRKHILKFVCLNIFPVAFLCR